MVRLRPPKASGSRRSALAPTMRVRCARGTERRSVGGSNYVGQSSPPEGETFFDIASGRMHTCALRTGDGAAVCWGSDVDFLGDYRGQATPPYGVEFSAISAGEDFTCALRSEDSAPVCWGEGFLENQPEHRPFSSVTDESFTLVSSGVDHVCALREDQTAACWGDNFANKASPPPRAVHVQSAAAPTHTCALRADDGVAVCWGSNLSPGNSPREGDYKGQASPPYGESFTVISSGSAHTLCPETGRHGGLLGRRRLWPVVSARG